MNHTVGEGGCASTIACNLLIRVSPQDAVLDHRIAVLRITDRISSCGSGTVQAVIPTEGDIVEGGTAAHIHHAATAPGCASDRFIGNITVEGHICECRIGAFVKHAPATAKRRVPVESHLV